MLTAHLTGRVAAADGFDEAQVSTHAQVATAYYVVGLVAIALAVAGVFMFDAGLSRRGNVLHTLTQKLAAAVAGGLAMAFLGFAIWDVQFTQAFGSDSPVKDAIQSWWLFGDNINAFSHQLDHEVVPDAEAFQAFYAIFIIFGAFFSALLAGSVIERVRTRALVAVAVVFAGLVIPVGAYLVYGPVGPLSNAGTHDFGGAFFYILLGTWSLVLVWRAKARPGAFATAPGAMPLPHNMTLVVLGMLLFVAGLCGYVLLNGFIVQDAGFFGITLNESGIGVVLTNLMMTIMAGGVGGLVAWRATGNVYFFLVSPIAAWVAASASMDVVDPWQSGLVALFAPLVVVGTYHLMKKARLDDVKIVPIALGPAIYGALATGLVASGTRQGGYLGLEGDYAFQHATIGIGQQALGVVAFIALGLLSALLVVGVVEKLLGLRDERVDNGLDTDLDRAVLGLAGYDEPSAAGQVATD
ncbi:ammonium transporter [Nocardioides sp. J54]|uniref:ammonium transporter n=1 Tax=Nocardioides sp. J54 TaxID=935866 RepID=UPI0004AF1A66|nr:ammonium transporter [Nocardioides sp. J54]